MLPHSPRSAPVGTRLAALRATPRSLFAIFALCLTACGSTSESTSPEGRLAAYDAGPSIDWTALDAGAPDKHPDSGVYVYADGGLVIREDRFVTSVVSFTPAGCTGFGAAGMPETVLGPPVGGGNDLGGLDVVSLGSGGSIVLSFAPNAIVDGPGPDFLVFENPFLVGATADTVFAEPGEVSVSEDGTTWKTFPCTATAYPYGACAGWHPVFSSPGNGISPVDPAVAGGDAFDLADVGLSRARFVRIVDKTHESCAPNAAGWANTNGFDLDAVSIVNAETR